MELAWNARGGGPCPLRVDRRRLAFCERDQHLAQIRRQTGDAVAAGGLVRFTVAALVEGDDAPACDFPFTVPPGERVTLEERIESFGGGSEGVVADELAAFKRRSALSGDDL